MVKFEHRLLKPDAKRTFDTVGIGAIESVNIDLAHHTAALERLSNSIHNGIRLIDMLSGKYKPSDTVDQEVIDYIVEYQTIQEEFGMEGMADSVIAAGETAVNIIKSIVKTLWEWLCNLWDGCLYCFKYASNSRFRCAQQFETNSKTISNLAKFPDKATEFGRYQVDGFITFDEAKEVLKSVEKIYSMLDELSSKIDSDMDDPEAFVKKEGSKCGIIFKENRFHDGLTGITFKRGTLASLGWTADKSIEFHQDCIKVSGNKARLDRVVIDLEKSVKTLRAEINTDGSSKKGRDLKEVQKELTRKNLFLSTIRACLVIYSNRLAGLAKLMTAVAEVSDSLMDNKSDM